MTLSLMMWAFVYIDYLLITCLNEADLPDNTRQAGMHTHYLQILTLSPEWITPVNQQQWKGFDVKGGQS